MSARVELWHYTCDHAHRELGNHAATLLSAAQLSPEAAKFWPASYIWLTDLAIPDRAALGLTSLTLSCDRMRHRYRVLDRSSAFPWLEVRKAFPTPLRAELEVPGTKLRHWWVSVEPVPVVWDPR